MSDFVMPSLGADMEAATLLKWRIAPGARVSRGDIVAEVDTDKGVIEIECFQSGIVDRLITEPGTKVPVGTVMAVIHGDAEPPSSAAVTPPPPAPPPRPAVRISPLARKRATELGLDLAHISGTGPGGAIQVADIERTAGSAPAAPAPAAPAALAAPVAPAPAAPVAPVAPVAPGWGMRQAIAAAMAKSKREIPHYYLQTRIDMTRTLAWLHAENEKRTLDQRLLAIVPLLKGVAAALGDVPALNGFWVNGAHAPAPDIHIGVAIAMRGGGLVAPAVHHVNRLSCDELMRALADLIPRARAGRLRGSEMTDATITVTSLGDLGVETVYGIIYPPQVALVGFGKILEQPWVEDGRVTARPVVAATLAGDHRATDGHVGGQFLDALARRLLAPEQL